MKIKSLLFVLCSISLIQTNASHLSSGYITYEFQAPDNYRFHLHLMRDCQGIPSPFTANLSVSSTTVPMPQSIAVTANPAMSGSLPFGTCYIPGGVSSCNGGTFYGIALDVLSSAWISMPPASDRMISYTNCCMGGNVLNLNNSSNNSVFLPLEFDNLNNPANGSPVLNPGPIPVYCVNTASQFDFSAVDPDGDSLSYALENVFGGYSPTAGLLPLSYSPGFSFSNPISSATAISLNPVSGIFDFTPNMNGEYQIGVKINEYRNGVLIGSSYRSQRIVVINGMNNPTMIIAKTFFDGNNNQIQDAGEAVIPFANIEFNNGSGSTTFYTDLNGKLHIPVSTGTFTLKAYPPNSNFVSNPDSNVVNITGAGQVDSSSVFAIAASGIPVNDLMVNLVGQNPRPGFARNYFTTVKNNGNTVQSAVASLNYDATLTPVGFSVTPDSISAGFLSWNIAALQPLSYEFFHVQLKLDTAVVAGINMDIIANVNSGTTDVTPNDNTDSLHVVVVNSFDPNEKTVEPNGDLDISIIQNQGWLNYTVFFQNTGTAPAINVRIHDVLDSNLNKNTFELTGFSHPMHMDIENGNKLVFRFNNIMLPDSNANEPMSHGFVSYRIKANNNLMVGNQIQNTAYIYFDFNQAIITNTTLNTVSLSTATATIMDDVAGVIYPNPASDVIYIKALKDVTDAEIFDVSGRKLMNFSLNLNSERSLDVSRLGSGFYILKLSGKNLSKAYSFIKK